MTRPSPRVLLSGVLFVSLVVAGCRCDSKVQKVNPSAGIAPTQVDFGKVKVGTTAPGAFVIKSLSRASVSITSITLENGSAPGGAAAFTISEKPEVVPDLEEVTVNVTFAPTDVLAYEALVKIESNDPENPILTVLMTGEGAQPDIVVTPQCNVDAGCVGKPVISNTELDFGSDAFARQVPVPANKLPNVSIVNEGDVELVVTALEVQGTDVAAFTLVGNTDELPNDPAALIKLQHGEGRNVPIRFRPTSEQQQSYTAELVVKSDDPDESEIRITLKGELRPNLPPVICANVTRVVSPDNLVANYNAASDWAPLLVPPPSGYDFSMIRAIEPKSNVQLSANSSSDTATCTTDPEDERNGLTYAWTVESAPSGAGTVALGGAAGPTATFIPFATGEYVLRLTVKDAQQHVSTTTMKLAVARKEDLVAQISWNGADGGFKNVDLDLHLIRPFSSQGTNPFSGAFSYFDESRPDASVPEKTAGDRNGYADAIQRNPANAGFNYDWGEPGSFDDPRLNLDETGNGPLIENISLNYPENDPLCATAACRYKVMVHFFRDDRATNLGACSVNGSCQDGEQCNCANAAQACVANEAPRDGGAIGTGQCTLAPQATLKIFVRANPVPAAEIPLPPDVLTVPAPCHMVYLADVIWPRKGAPDGGTALDGGSEPVIVAKSTATSSQIQRYGYRTQGSLVCTPDTTEAGPAGQVQWYSPQPR